MKVYFFLFIIQFAFYALAFSQETPIRFDFSKSSHQANNITIQGAGFGQYPMAQIDYSIIPVDPDFEDATDGHGAVITASPGEGLMIIGQIIHTTNAALIRCAIKSNSPAASITLAALGNSENAMVSTITASNGQFFVDGYQRLATLFAPPSTGFSPIIQVINTSVDKTITVYVDNLDVHIIDSEKYYHGQLLDGDKHDPTTISLPAFGAPLGTSQNQLTIYPERAVINIGQDMKLSSPNAIDPSRIFWWSGSNDITAIDQSGLTNGISGGNSWVAAQYRNESNQSLVFVNPVPSHHNSRNYEWYQTQMGTGEAEFNNCGPTSAQMAIKWYSGNDIPVQQIRDLKPRDNQWWFNTDVYKALNEYDIPYAVHPIKYKEDIIDCLKRGNIVILCAKMGEVAYSREPFFGRFYENPNGHFFIIKGWSEDNKYFVVYDPNSWTNDYDKTGVMLGRNRFYLCRDVINAMANWWPYCMEIGAAMESSSISPTNIPEAAAGRKRLSHSISPH